MIKTQRLQSLLPCWAGRLLSRFDNPLIGFFFSITNLFYYCEECRFHIPRRLESLGFRSLLFFDLYEKGERDLLRGKIAEGDRVLEVGGCMGVVSCLINRQLGEGGIHVVLEPNPELVPILRKNRELNDSSYEIEPCAVGDGGTMKFTFGDSIVTGRVGADSAGRQAMILTRTVEDLKSEYGEFSVLVADIEGGEVQLLEQMEGMMGKLRMAVIEFHPEIIGEAGLRKCREILENAGMRLDAELLDSQRWVRTR